MWVMMKLVRRWYCWLPALLLGAAILYAGYRVTHPPWADTEAWRRYQAVKLGMTEDEVRSSLGTLGRVYEYTMNTEVVWQMGDDEVRVFSGPGEDRASCKSAVIQRHEFYDPPYEQSWWDRLRARLGW
jgi:hypothetical protein